MSSATQTRPDAHRRSRLAPVGEGFNKVAGLLPNWAWGLLWLAVAILYGLYGDQFNDSLYG